MVTRDEVGVSAPPSSTLEVLLSAAARSGGKVSVAPFVRAAKVAPTDGFRTACYLPALTGEPTRKVEPSAAQRCRGDPTRQRVKSLFLSKIVGKNFCPKRCEWTLNLGCIR